MNDQRVNIQTFIDEEKFSFFQKIIFAMCFLVVLLDGFDTAAIGYIAPSLLGEWSLTRPQLSPVLSAALFGLAFGALSSGPLADKFGRRIVLIVATFIFGIFCLASSFAQDLQTLTILRFLTGIGLGAAMPNTVTLMGEYSPTKKRSFIINMMFCGFSLGAALGGFLAAWMIPQFGWRSVLQLGGVAPILLAIVMLFALPESVRFMAAKRFSHEKISAVLSKISSKARQATSFFIEEVKVDPEGGKTGLALVLSKKYLVGSVMLWVTYFMGLVIFYGLINWMPLIFKESGIQTRDAVLISALFPLGGVGAIFFGYLMDKFNGNKIIAIGYLLTAASIWAMGQAAGNIGFLVVSIFLAGTFMNTAQSSLGALAASFYPTSGRASGIASMMGIGRFGGIAGSFLVGALQTQNLGFSSLFTILAIPALIAAAALLIKQQVHLKG